VWSEDDGSREVMQRCVTVNMKARESRDGVKEDVSQ